MPIKNDDVIWMKPPQIGLFEQLYVPAILQGLQTTVEHSIKALFGKGQVTQQFPEVEPKLPANYRGVHRLNRDEQGRVKCVACYMCSTACPAHCIDIVAAPAPTDWHKDGREKYPETFVIDELRCIYCGMCEQACPVDAIELTTLYDLTGMSREEMMFDKEKLLSVFDETTKPNAKFPNPVRTKAGRLGVASELADQGLTSSSTAQS
ncbi:MAG: NADH-quinone oxidoreductase subunit I [Planctomycetia bacterium]|nr:NADH-quinone oxidoreductase subunit I [Planctomycetia bacterium]